MPLHILRSMKPNIVHVALPNMHNEHSISNTCSSSLLGTSPVYHFSERLRNTQCAIRLTSEVGKGSSYITLPLYLPHQRGSEKLSKFPKITWLFSGRQNQNASLLTLSWMRNLLHACFSPQESAYQNYLCPTHIRGRQAAPRICISPRSLRLAHRPAW